MTNSERIISAIRAELTALGLPADLPERAATIAGPDYNAFAYVLARVEMESILNGIPFIADALSISNGRAERMVESGREMMRNGVPYQAGRVSGRWGAKKERV